jgi:hypothetical protein
VGIHSEMPMNINLDINNERQDCKIHAVGGYLWEGEQRRLRCGTMVDRPHILLQNRTNKHLEVMGQKGEMVR